MKSFIITIDGPAASGKEKIAKFVSKKYKLKRYSETKVTEIF